MKYILPIILTAAGFLLGCFYTKSRASYKRYSKLLGQYNEAARKYNELLEMYNNKRT